MGLMVEAGAPEFGSSTLLDNDRFMLREAAYALGRRGTSQGMEGALFTNLPERLEPPRATVGHRRRSVTAVPFFKGYAATRPREGRP